MLHYKAKADNSPLRAVVTSDGDDSGLCGTVTYYKAKWLSGMVIVEWDTGMAFYLTFGGVMSYSTTMEVE